MRVIDCAAPSSSPSNAAPVHSYLFCSATRAISRRSSHLTTGCGIRTRRVWTMEVASRPASAFQRFRLKGQDIVYPSH